MGARFHIERENTSEEEHDVVPRYLRKWPERQDEEKLQELLSDLKNRLWFGDKVGFEEDPRPRHTWVKKGSKPQVPYLGNHIRYNTVGAVNPKGGEFFSLFVPHSDKEVFQVFLDEFAKHTATD